MQSEKLEDSNHSWEPFLDAQKRQNYLIDVLSFIEKQRANGKEIYPKDSEIFAAFESCQFDDVKVVILGQDPYHGTGQAHGLCFSVQNLTPIPPSLKNIFKELVSDLGCPTPDNGSLTKWAQQGVLLLNSVLTVEAGNPGSHAGIGWERFTDNVIDELNIKKTGLVFMLWGAYAQKKGARIDSCRHLVLKASHPSPFSAHSGFFNCRHFSKANKYLKEQGRDPVRW